MFNLIKIIISAFISYIFLILIFIIFFVSLEFLPTSISFPIIDILNKYFEWGYSNQVLLFLIFFTFCIIWAFLFLRIINLFKRH